MTWKCRACGARVGVAQKREPVVMRVTEPGNHQTRVVTVNGAVVHQCRVDACVLDGQLVLAFADEQSARSRVG
jgi:hypothetical protein